MVLVGCTTSALRRNAFNQSKTVADFLADQVLYNLAMYERYYHEGTNFNGIPSFIKLQTGQAQVQQSVNGQLALKLPLKGGDEIDPQISGTHQTQDNWAFAPVVEPAELNRLYHLYRVLFNPAHDNEFAQIFPNANTQLGPDGKPLLKYSPILTNGNEVVMISNQPQFTATFVKPTPPKPSDVPGAKDDNGNVLNGWFSFASPKLQVPAATTWIHTGPYLGRDIWITNKENFFKFALLVLGPTNSLGSQFLSAPYSIQNGLLLPLR
jgi:hypothetical protein